MSVATVILIILIIAVIIAIIIGFIIFYKKYRQPIVTGKSVIIYGHLCNFVEGYEAGAFIKKTPVGKNKDILRFDFTVKETDEYGEIQIVKKTLNVHKNYVFENDRSYKLYPKDIVDVNLTAPESRKVVEYVRGANDIRLLTQASREDKGKYEKLFIEDYGGEISLLEIKRQKELRKLEEEKEEKEMKK